MFNVLTHLACIFFLVLLLVFKVQSLSSVTFTFQFVFLCQFAKMFFPRLIFVFSLENDLIIFVKYEDKSSGTTKNILS